MRSDWMEYIILSPQKEKTIKAQFDDAKVESDGTKITVTKKMDLSSFDAYRNTETNVIYLCKKGSTEIVEVLVPEHRGDD